MSTSHLRVATPASNAPIPRDEATDQAREQFQAARNAYIDCLESFAQYRLRWMLRSEKKVTNRRIPSDANQRMVVTVRTLRSTRDAAQRMVEQALAVVSALDACIDTCERAAR